MILTKDIPPKYWLTALILLLLYLAGLQFDLVIDSGKYAAISKNIYESGDLIHLKIFDQAYDQKPPFMFWLAMLSFKLLGVSNFAFKLPTFLSTLFGTFATYKLGKALYNKRTGMLAAIMLISSQSMLLYNNDTHTDVILTMCIIIALWQLHRFIKEGNGWNYLAGFIFVGFAVITKGPIGLAVPVFAVVSHLIITRRYRLLWPLPWLPGLAVISAIAAPVLIGLYHQFGTEGLKFFFWTNNVGRITGEYTGSNNDFAFYLHTLGYLFLPFSILAYFGAFQEVKNWISGRFSFADSKEGITMAIPVFLTILSVSKMKSPHYMLPVIPLIAIMTAKWTDRIISGKLFSLKTAKTLVIIQYIVIILLVAGSLLIPTVFFPASNVWFWIAVALMLGALVYIGLRSNSMIEKLIHIPVMAVLFVNLILTSHFFPQIFQYNATPIASRDFNAAGSEKATLFVMNNLDYEIGFYSKNHPQVVADSTLTKLEEAEEPWVYTDHVGRDQIIEKFPQSNIFKHYQYRRVSKIGLNFLIPSKRAGELSDMYLIKVKK
ncbi:MAG: ArnT family glycosyltransferase [Mangrovibacterium sp.]